MSIVPCFSSNVQRDPELYNTQLVTLFNFLTSKLVHVHCLKFFQMLQKCIKKKAKVTVVLSRDNCYQVGRARVFVFLFLTVYFEKNSMCKELQTQNSTKNTQISFTHIHLQLTHFTPFLHSYVHSHSPGQASHVCALMLTHTHSHSLTDTHMPSLTHTSTHAHALSHTLFFLII